MILVTGGTGLVGTHLLFDLCRSGKQVRALKRSNSNIANVKKVFSYYTASQDELLKNIEWVNADLMDIYSLTDAMKDITEVYHCAAVVSFDPRFEKEMMKINIEGTANMVNAALLMGVKKFCHVSSIATIGHSEHAEIFTEKLLWKLSPHHSNYAISKYAAEREVWRASEEGLPVVIVNPSLIIGAGNWKQSSSSIFTRGYNGIKFYTDGINGFIDVRDVTSLMIALMRSNIINQRFILNSENISYKHFLDILHQEFNKPLPSVKAVKLISNIAWRMEKIYSWLTNKPPFLTKDTANSAHAKNRFSHEKIRNAFPDYKFISIEQSIKDTCRLFLKDKAVISL